MSTVTLHNNYSTTAANTYTYSVGTIMWGLDVDIPPGPLYKVLAPGRKPMWAPNARPWPYRRWTDEEVPSICESGWHFCTLEQLPWWIQPHGVIWEVEVRGDCRLGFDRIKYTAAQARLIRVERRLDQSWRTRWCWEYKYELVDTGVMPEGAMEAIRERLA